MSTIHTEHTYRVDLDSCPLVAALSKPLSHADSLADTLVIAVRRGMEPADLSGMTAQAYLTFSTRQTLPLAGDVSGSAITVALPEDAYAIPGPFRLTVQLLCGDVRHTLLHLTGDLARTSSEALISSDQLLPTLPALLEQISGMQQATAAAMDATDAAVCAIAALNAATCQSSPAILCEASGPVAAMADAAPRPVVALVSGITALQAGDGSPSTDNICPFTAWDAVQLSHGAAYDEAAAPLCTAALPEAVWGGRLDWTTGILTITHKCITFTGTEKLSRTTTSRQWLFMHTVDGLETGGASHNRAKSSHFTPSTGIWNTVGEGIMTNNSQILFGWGDGTKTVAEFKAFLTAQYEAGTPVQTVYKLATPFDIQLNPHQLTLLAGNNALWSDTGDTSVTYVADTKTYIDNAVAAIAAAIINA